jgi:heat shock protein HslJ
MKKFTGIFFCAALVLLTLVFVSCAGGASLGRSKTVFNDDVLGKEWILLELRSQGKTVSIDRKKLDAGFPNGAFTINFEEDKVSGVGAPNRYFGPCTVNSDKTLSIGNLASTMMAALFEPDELKEQEFFNYLANAKRWDLKSGKLELYSANSSGAETVLVFGPK